jgi:hypothetical protein
MNDPSTSPAKLPLFPCSRSLTKIREAWVQDLRTKRLEPILTFYGQTPSSFNPPGNASPAPPPSAHSSKT